jgi:aspartate racemase
MKIIGMIGGMSWESTLEYYRIINQTVRNELGGLHSARVLLYSVDFHDIEILQKTNQWKEAGEMMATAARRLENGGADFLIICTNTMHLLAEDVEKAVNLPLVHIADATAEKIKKNGIEQVGVLGTRFTMEKEFYRGRLMELGLEVLIPPEGDREIIHRVIYDELCLGNIRPESKRRYLKVISQLQDRGAEGIILGCTEIGLLIKQEDTEITLFDTTQIHAETAAKWSISK